MSRSFWIIAGFAALACFPSCRKEGSHLPRAQMASVVADLQLADVYSGMVRDTTRPGIEKAYDSLAVWTNSILSQHGITREGFNRSMDWYRDHPAELDSMFAAVIPILEKAQK